MTKKVKKTRQEKKEEKGIYEIRTEERLQVKDLRWGGSYYHSPTLGLNLKYSEGHLAKRKRGRDIVDGVFENSVSLRRVGSSRRPCVSHITIPIEKIPELIQTLDKIYKKHHIFEP